MAGFYPFNQDTHLTMIDQALSFIRDEVNNYLQTVLPDANSGRVVAENIVQKDSAPADAELPSEEREIILSLINIEEEKVFKDQSKFVRTQGGNLQVMEPEIKLNVYLIFAANFTDYLTGIKALSEIIGFFQANRVFDAANYPAMDPALQRLVFELHTFSLSQSFEFWQSLGGSFLPSVIYRMRMLIVQKGQTQGTASPTQSIGINSSPD
jgi:hypothetical protein